MSTVFFMINRVLSSLATLRASALIPLSLNLPPPSS